MVLAFVHETAFFFSVFRMMYALPICKPQNVFAMVFAMVKCIHNINHITISNRMSYKYARKSSIKKKNKNSFSTFLFICIYSRVSSALFFHYIQSSDFFQTIFVTRFTIAIIFFSFFLLYIHFVFCSVFCCYCWFI